MVKPLVTPIPVAERQRSVFLKAGQYERIGKFVNLNRFGHFSQFVQDAIEDKLLSLETSANLAESSITQLTTNNIPNNKQGEC